MHTNFFTLFLKPGTFLNEAHEGCDACARADHDDRVAGLEGQPELGLADVHGHGGLVSVVGDRFGFEPVGGDAFVDAARLRLVLHHDCADVNAVGMHLSQEGAVEQGFATGG